MKRDYILLLPEDTSVVIASFAKQSRGICRFFWIASSPFERLAMTTLRVFSILISTVLLFTSAHATTSYPVDQKLYDLYPWSLTYYYGQTVSAPLVDVLKLKWHRWPEHLQSLELAYVLEEDDPFRQLMSPLFGVVELALDTSIRYGANENNIYEFNPYLIFRWANLPWNHVVTTSFAIGEGVSYDTSIPAIEKRQNTDTKRLLNFLMLEATFADPNYPRLQLLLRIHHRSGAYGFYHAGNTGSNVVSAG